MVLLMTLKGRLSVSYYHHGNNCNWMKVVVLILTFISSHDINEK